MSIPSSFSFGGLTFHLYGFIIGLSAWVGVTLVERRARGVIPERCLWWVIGAALGAGLVGARLWHVFTDYYRYLDNLAGVVAVWNGGLSILGGVLGGILGIWLAVRRSGNCTAVRLRTMLDFAVFGLPAAQAIGRFANALNQELYGLPTSLPWAVEISPANRPEGYASVSHYHPLFFYEALATGVAAAYIWWKKNHWQIGSGQLFRGYVLYYAAIRFLLDFLRFERDVLLYPVPLGTNQVVLLLVISGIMGWRWYAKKSTSG